LPNSATPRPAMTEQLFNAPTRRRALKVLAGLGIGTVVFQRALAQEATKAKTVTADMVKQAEWVSGLDLTEDQRKNVAGSLNRELAAFEQMRKVKLPNSVPSALTFNPAPWLPPSTEPRG